MSHPISKLNTKMALLWGGCSILGAILAGYGGAGMGSEVGRFLLAMCFGYMLFGLGIKRNGLSGN
ncbi:hypothetical protein ACT3UJ_06640 [Halomonas sp. 86]|uniref:hypothetical protein n=1 Tax=unclassified Halomonas TaxID=2609666 RepID=UPI0040340A21